MPHGHKGICIASAAHAEGGKDLGQLRVQLTELRQPAVPISQMGKTEAACGHQVTGETSGPLVPGSR